MKKQTLTDLSTFDKFLAPLEPPKTSKKKKVDVLDYNISKAATTFSNNNKSGIKYY